MNEEGNMGWAVSLTGFALWTLVVWCLGRRIGWAKCFTTAYNKGWEDRQKVEDYIDRTKEGELQVMVAGVEQS